MQSVDSGHAGHGKDRGKRKGQAECRPFADFARYDQIPNKDVANDRGGLHDYEDYSVRDAESTGFAVDACCFPFFSSSSSYAGSAGGQSSMDSGVGSSSSSSGKGGGKPYLSDTVSKLDLIKGADLDGAMLYSTSRQSLDTVVSRVKSAMQSEKVIAKLPEDVKKIHEDLLTTCIRWRVTDTTRRPFWLKVLETRKARIEAETERRRGQDEQTLVAESVNDDGDVSGGEDGGTRGGLGNGIGALSGTELGQTEEDGAAETGETATVTEEATKKETEGENVSVYGGLFVPSDHFLTKAGEECALKILDEAKDSSAATFDLDFCPMLPDVVGMLLLYLDESECREMLEVMFLGSGARISVASLLVDHYSVILFHQIFDDLIETRLPTLASHLADCHMHSIAFSYTWFARCFVGTLSYPLAMRIFDCLLGEGSRFLFQIGLALLWIHKDAILQKEDPLAILHLLRSSELMASVDGNVLFDKAFSFAVDIAEIDDLSVKNASMNISLGASNSEYHHILDSPIIGGAMKHSQARRSSFSVHDKSFSEKKNKMVTFTLEKANWLGFDLDHTLVEYEMKVYEQIIFKAAYTHAREKMADFGFTSMPKDVPEYNANKLTAKGLLVDKNTCNILKISAARRIVGAYRGLTALSFEETQKIYGKKALHFSAGVKNERYSMIVTTIDRPLVPLLSHMVAAVLVHNRECKNNIEMRKIFALAAASITHASSKFCKGSFRDMAKDDPQKLFKKHSANRQWLVDIFQRGMQKTLLLTNAKYDHMEQLMKFSYGSDWALLFDVIICDAKKNVFFNATCTRPLREISSVTKKAKRDDVRILKTGKVYCGGNVTDLEPLLRAYVRSRDHKPMSAATFSLSAPLQMSSFLPSNFQKSPVSGVGDESGKSRRLGSKNSVEVGGISKEKEDNGEGQAGPLVCYFGDHVPQDVVAAKMAGWDAVAIVPEQANLIKESTESESLPGPAIGQWDDIFFCEHGAPTYYALLIQEWASLCVPSVEFIVKKLVHDKLIDEKTMARINSHKHTRRRTMAHPEDLRSRLDVLQQKSSFDAWQSQRPLSKMSAASEGQDEGESV